jgi:hypothetical protein
VVLVREGDGWEAFFCTDPEATVAQVLGAVSERAAVEVAHAHYPSSNILLARRRAG